MCTRQAWISFSLIVSASTGTETQTNTHASQCKIFLGLVRMQIKDLVSTESTNLGILLPINPGATICTFAGCNHMITYSHTLITIIFIQERSSNCRSVLVCLSDLEAAQSAGWMVPCLPPCSMGDSKNQPKEVWTMGRYHSRQGTAFDLLLIHQYNNRGQAYNNGDR